MGCTVSGGEQQDGGGLNKLLRHTMTLDENGAGGSANAKRHSVDPKSQGLLLKLSEKSLLTLMDLDKENAGSKISVGSHTDEKLSAMASFSSKTVTSEGNQFDDAQQCIGYACKKGLKPTDPNQDSFMFLKVEDQFALYGVFDGHGKCGHDVSQFVKEHLPKVLLSQEDFLSNPPAALLRTFESVQDLIQTATNLQTINAERSGSTCSVVLQVLAPQNMLYVAHIGDSRVVLGRKVATDADQFEWRAEDLTIDHKPDLPEEKQRIEEAGGSVEYDGCLNHRVFAKDKKDTRGKKYPGLNMSRAFGDLNGWHDAGISAIPDVKVGLPREEKVAAGVVDDGSGEAVEQRSPSISSFAVNPNTKQFLLLCSDGVWEFMSSIAAVKEVAKFKETEAIKSVEHLCSVSWGAWMKKTGGQVVDDITAVVVHLCPGEK